MSKICVDVVFPIPLFNYFTYLVPENLKELVKPGQRVIAPIKNTSSLGFIIRVHQEIREDIELKYIVDLIDTQPLIQEELLEFLTRLSEYYLTPLGKVLNLAFPKEIKVVKNRRFILQTDPGEKDTRYSDLVSEIRGKQSVSLSSLRKKFNAEYLKHGLLYLKRNGYVMEVPFFKERGTRKDFWVELDGNITSKDEILEKLRRAPRQRELISLLLEKKRVRKSKIPWLTSTILNSLMEKNMIKITEIPYAPEKLWSQYDAKQKEVILSREQAAVFSKIKENLREGDYRCFLLHGVTGSGKTEIYIKLAKEALKMDKGVLMLVPEITLTAHFAGRFRGEFGDDVAIWHSNLPSQDRLYIWEQVRTGRKKFVVGARSAIFLPIKKLGLIIVDEEQDTSFKQDGIDPRYNARDAVLFRAQRNSATVVLGSATPSMESIYNAIRGKFVKLNLERKYSGVALPAVHVVDMKKECKEVRNTDVLFSSILLKKIDETLSRGQQILLLQNRRGFSNFILCLNCGWAPQCPNCSITLTYHKNPLRLLCHYCGYHIPPPSVCPRCNGTKIVYPGSGTEKAEEQLRKTFGNVKITRLDIDTARQRGFTERTLKSFGKGDIHVLVGTQIIAKGLDFPNVGLVGVLNADIGLNIPDFRARERVFRLLYQVIGRVGRGDIPGEVVIQTFNPENIAVKYAAQRSIKKFYNIELSERLQLNYPPFSRIATVVVSDTNPDKAEEAAFDVRDFLFKNRRGVEIIGPGQAPIFKVKNRFRFMILLKSSKQTDPSGRILRGLLKQFSISGLYNRLSKRSRIVIDVDPQDML
ncbi:MAG: primosomal protein N' [Candidatus Marinimicrobia bacterium]|nr:primosomal protein N' [Candidatus Neomarinimicrobiota bacterium]